MREIGQIKCSEKKPYKKGFLADIIAVEDDSTKDISIMNNVRFVMKDGVVNKN